MELTYEDMKKFMQDYYAAFNCYANDPGTIHKINEYWTPNFKAVAYLRLSGEEYPVIYSTSKEFQDFLHRIHGGMNNSFNPLDFVIDEKSKKVVILIRIVGTNIQNGDKIETFGIEAYQLIIGDDNNFKIDRLDFICDSLDKVKRLDDDFCIYAF